VSRAESPRKHLAVHARKLALEPDLQILRRHRRSLLRRLEQAHRSALADHVHRNARIGPPVLISESWYKITLLIAIELTPRICELTKVAAWRIPAVRRAGAWKVRTDERPFRNLTASRVRGHPKVSPRSVRQPFPRSTDIVQCPF